MEKIIKRIEAIFDKIYKYRFIVAIIILVILVGFKISGSFTSYWNHYFYKDENEGIIFGKAREIRYDEFVVNTMLAFSQYENNFEFTSNLLRGSINTNMFMLYGQPVKDIAILFRLFLVRLFIFKSRNGTIFFLVVKNDCFIFSNSRICNAYNK